MIEEGFIQLITTGLARISIVVPGGFAVQLPKDVISKTFPQAWSYRSILSIPTYLLAGQDALTTWEVQLDCHGLTMLHAIQLAKGIDSILQGSYTGVLTDPDSTVVQGIFRLPSFVDGFNDSNRSFVRSLEYRVIYQDQ